MQTLHIGTWGGGLITLRRGGRSAHFEGRTVNALVMLPEGQPLALVEGAALWRWTGEGWSRFSEAPAKSSAMAWLDDTLFLGTDDAQLFRRERDGSFTCLEAFEQTPGRERWYAGTAVVDGRTVGPPLGVRSMAATGDGAALLVNVHVGGIPRSTDGGARWAPTIDVEADVHQVVTHPRRAAWAAAATAKGLALSHDGGASWQLDAAGLHATHCSAVSFVGDEVWVSAAEGQFATRAAVYRRAMESGSLTRVPSLPEWFDGVVDTGGLAARGERVVVADARGNVLSSRDGGARFEQVASDVGFPLSLLVEP